MDDQPKIMIWQEEENGKTVFIGEVKDHHLCVGEGDTLEECYYETLDNYNATKNYCEKKGEPFLPDKQAEKFDDKKDRRNAMCLYATLYQVLEAEDPDNVPSRIEYLTNKNFADLADLYKSFNLEKAKQKSNWTFTEDEKTILRNVEEGYKWLVRDADKTLWLYSVYKPEKKEGNWESRYSWNFPFDSIFQCIKWSDDEPCEFRKFL